MDRLVDKDYKDKLESGYYGDINHQEEVYIKLGKLEDIMEKYGIESVDELDLMLNKPLCDGIISFKRDLDKISVDAIKLDRDTWKKACELACEELVECDDFANINEGIDYYYTQAQEEMKNES